MPEAAWSALWGAVGGGITWYCSDLIGAPLLGFLALRDRVRSFSCVVICRDCKGIIDGKVRAFISGHYALVREAIASTYPAIFADFNLRIAAPAGFDRPNSARKRQWKTKSGKATFIAPSCLSEDPDLPEHRDGVLTLITVRSNDHSTRRSMAMRTVCAASTERDRLHLRRFGLTDGDIIDLVGEAGDGVERLVCGLRAARCDIPSGSCAGHYPECKPLLPLWHHAARKPRPRCEINSSADSKTPDGNSEIESRRSQSERLALKLKTTSASGTKRTNH